VKIEKGKTKEIKKKKKRAPGIHSGPASKRPMAHLPLS
jgi:hypothetical protein